MAALDTITHELTALETEEEQVLSWRRASLLAAGYDQRLSLKLALRSDVDLHLAVQLGRDGCPPTSPRGSCSSPAASGRLGVSAMRWAMLSMIGHAICGFASTNGAEVPRSERVAAEVGLGRHRRAPRLVVEEADLAEVVAGPEQGLRLPADDHRGADLRR